MPEYARDYSIDELMVATIARDCRDGEVGFLGLGTSGRAFQLAVGMPFASGCLARLTHAPDFNIMFGLLINPRPEQITEQVMVSDADWLDWDCDARVTLEDIFDIFRGGKLGIGFVSGAQIDQYGNLNIVAIGDYERPKVRLVGCLLQTEHMAFANRNIIPVELNPRTFVPKVDFISGAGFLSGGDARQEVGLPGGGPGMVVTDKAILDFETPDRRMRIRSLHPGVTVEEVQELCGFDLVVPADVPQTEPPTVEQVDLLRNVIDPHSVLMNHS